MNEVSFVARTVPYLITRETQRAHVLSPRRAHTGRVSTHREPTDGQESRSISKGAEPAGLFQRLWQRGAVRRDAVQVALAARVRLSAVLACRGHHHPDARPAVVQALPASNLAHRRIGVRALEVAADDLVSRPVPAYPAEQRHLRAGAQAPLGVCYATAWSIKHKLMQSMLERDAERQLTGVIEVDDVYLRRGMPRATARARLAHVFPSDRRLPGMKGVPSQIRACYSIFTSFMRDLATLP
jgi:hypothetical protein